MKASLTLSILLLASLSCAPPSEETSPDVSVYLNAMVVTMNRDMPQAESIAVSNGRILAVGDEVSVRAAAGGAYKVYDLDGATIVPGFIESHEHMMMQGGLLEWADLTPATTRNRDEALEKLRRQPLENGWILGFGIEPFLYEGEQGRPSWRESLDSVSTEIPLLAVHNSGHAAYANTRAFEAAGITKNTPSPTGGEFVKGPDGELNGFINGRPAWTMMHGFPLVTSDTTQRSARTRARVGITTASELAITSSQYLEHLASVTKQPDFAVRIVGGLFITMPGLEEVAPRVSAYETDLFRVKFIKSWADGSIQGGTGAFSEGYYDLPEAAASGLTATQEEFDAQVLKMYELGLWPALHANGDAAMDLALHALERAQERIGDSNIRPQLIHCQLVRPEQFDRIAALGATMTFFATHVYNYGDLHRDRFLGPERAPKISAMKTAFDKGIPAAMHDDAPIALPNPLFNIWVAVNRTTRSGKSLGPDLRLTPEQALAAYTREAAFEFGMEDDAGTIEVGKFADFVVLEENPLTVAPARIKDIEIVGTVMNGRVTYLRGDTYGGETR